MPFSEYKIQEEDYEQPIFLNYRKQWKCFKQADLFKIKNQIEKFEKIHPLLTLVDSQYTEVQMIKTKNAPLFQDEQQYYSEIQYKYTKYIITNYYEPTEELHDFLQFFSRNINNKYKEMIK